MSDDFSSTMADAPVPAYYDFTPKLLAFFPLDELSAALLSRADAIILGWTAEMQVCIPAATRLSFEQLADSLPKILPALASALGSLDANVRKELLVRSPGQGLTRFQQHYDPRDVMFEDRQLRQHVMIHLEQELDRRLTLPESLALAMGLDLMSQQAIVAFIDNQSAQLRTAAEAELRYLSFLSHDLNNNLNGVTLWLQVLKMQLQPKPEMATPIESIDSIQSSILTTIGGMGRLLQAERLRHGGRDVIIKPVSLRTLITGQTRAQATLAKKRDIRLVVDVDKTATIVTDPELLTLVLQNVIGNAVKFASPGVVQIRAEQKPFAGGLTQWSISVIDDGPGIPKEQTARIFRAFQRGTMEGKEGVGLGLAIASRAASLLGATLSVESTVGEGSRFTLTLAASADA